jgi:hypothetical protein
VLQCQGAACFTGLLTPLVRRRCCACTANLAITTLESRTRCATTANLNIACHAGMGSRAGFLRALVAAVALMSLHSAFAQEPCSEVCTTGRSPGPGFSNTPNGCGPTGVSGIVPDFRFTSCCNQHDLCYGNCGDTTFEFCNRQFYSCMLAVCGPDDPFCHAAAGCYAAAVETGAGCTIYRTSQERNCQCDPGTPAPSPDVSSLPTIPDLGICAVAGLSGTGSVHSGAGWWAAAVAAAAGVAAAGAAAAHG